MTRTVYAFGGDRLERLTAALGDGYDVVYQSDVVGGRPFGGVPVVGHLTLALATYAFLRREEPIVLADRFQPFRLVLLTLCRLTGSPYLARTRGSMWGEFRDRRSHGGAIAAAIGGAVDEAIRNVVLRRCDRVLAVSYFNRTQIVYELHLDPARVDVVPEPCDVRAFDDAPAGAFRTERSIPDGASLLLTVTNFDYREKARGIEHFLPAIERVLRDNPDARYVVAGEGSHRRAVERSVRSRCGDDVAGRVSFVGRYAPIESAVVDADVVVHPSFRDALPNAVIEAQAARTPVVVNPEGSGGGESLPDDVRGVQLAADRRAFRDRLERLLADPDLRRTVGERNRAVAADRYGPAAAARSFDAALSRTGRASASGRE